MTNQMVQYDLFGEMEAAEKAEQCRARQATAAARTFLSETPWPDLIAWWLHPTAAEKRLDQGEAKASYRRGPEGEPGWAWAIWRDGLRFEAGATWPGWGHRPRWCIPWAQLHEIREDNPELTAKLHQLAAGRGHPHSVGWRWWSDPFALHPQGWHPDYLQSERQPDYYDGCDRPDTAYADRLQAWRMALDVVANANPLVQVPGN